MLTFPSGDFLVVERNENLSVREQLFLRERDAVKIGLSSRKNGIELGLAAYQQLGPTITDKDVFADCPFLFGLKSKKTGLLLNLRVVGDPGVQKRLADFDDVQYSLPAGGGLREDKGQNNKKVTN